jgi:pimeloyl-ACP methyl ester carboxylesterase
MNSPIIDPMEVRQYLLENAPFSLAYKGGDTPSWQREARETLIRLLGMPNVRPPEDAFTVEWEKDYPRYREIRFRFLSEPRAWGLGHLLLPRGSQASSPASPPLMICLQGHGTGMHVSLGQNRNYEPDPGGEQDGDFALQCIDRGFAALALEQRGFGENGGNPEDGSPGCRNRIALSALLTGRTLAGERVWDISRSIDIALRYLKGFDPDRIGIMGHSGGGTTAFYAAIVEPRIAAAMTACCFSSYAASIGLISHCPCNYIPRVMAYFDMGDLAGLIAPRPLVIINGREDRIYPVDAAVRQFAVTEKIYAALGTGKNCAHVIGEGGHRFYAGPGWDAFVQLTGWR